MKKLLWMLPFIFLLLLPKMIENMRSTQFTYDTYEISGRIDDETEAAAAFNVIEQNLQAASENDIHNYLATLVSSAQEESRPEIESFFAEHSIQHTIMDVKIKKQEQNQIVFEIKQKAIDQENSGYRNHISTATHTLVKENDSWKIAETIMSNTKFL